MSPKNRKLLAIEWQQEKAELEKLVAEKTAELAQKNRELEIEAALERVRARTMAMLKSEELSQVASVMFKEFKQLNLINDIARIVININNEENGDCQMWLTQIGGAEISTNFQYNYLEHKLWEEEFRAYQQVEKNKRKEHKYIVIHEGKAFEALVAFGIEKKIVTPEDLKIIKEVGIQKWIEHIVWFAYGSLVIARDTPLSAVDFDILQRFTTVFEQTYTRFLDLEKAEAQTREAQIEAALERIRAKTMAMRESQQLHEVVKLIFGQLKILGIEMDLAAIHDFTDDRLGEVLWGATNEQVYPKKIFVPDLNNKWFKNLKKARKKEAPFLTDRFTKKQKDQFFEHFFGQTAARQASQKRKDFIFSSPAMVRSVALYKHTGLQILRYNDIPLNDTDNEIIRRISSVFEQTYTRFLDLQKAEKQTKEIEKIFNENQRLLHSILPKQIAEQIRKGQQTVVKRFEQVSILFADIVGFTSLSEQLSPQKVVDILNGLFSKFDDLTDKYQLEKIKTIGDAYMVASGVPEEKENHALVLFQFAQEMLSAIRNFNQVHHLQLEIRIGISSGPVVAGVIGKKKFAYDLWGDTVNTAARMEAYGQASCIQVAPASYALLKDDFNFEKIPNVEIKGKGKMDVYLWKN